MSTKIKILYIEYAAGDAKLANDMLKKAGIECEITLVKNKKSYKDYLLSLTPNIILCDDAHPTLNAVDALAILKEKGITIPLIVVTTLPKKNFAVNIVTIMKHGAYDYILKEHLDTLPDAVRNAIKKYKAEVKLLLSEHRYRQIVETAQEGIWIINENLITVFVNKKMCDILGYAAEEIIGKPNYIFKIEAEKAATLKRIGNPSLGVIETHESTFVTKNGKHVLCSITTNALFDEDGRYMGRLAMMTDITQRKAYEDVQKRSKANLSAIIENTTDLVYSLDADLRFITYNQRFKTAIKEVYGFNVEQGVNTLDFIRQFNPETAEKWENIYAKALSGETLQFVNEYPFGDEKIYLSYSVNPMWETGKVIGLSCFSRDITRQKLDEAAIKKSEASLRTVFNNTDMACILIDNGGKVISYNKLAKKFSEDYGNTPIEEGIFIIECVDKDRQTLVLDMLDKAQHGQTVSYQLKREINGAIKWFDVTWAGINNHENEDFGCIFTNKDITETKELEIEREKITSDLLQRNRALEQFTYIISHNLRAPVANIIGLSSLTADADVAGNGEVYKIIENISQSANKLDEVISDLNQVLQGNKGINEIIGLILLPELINDIEFSIKHLVEKERVSIICDFKQADRIFSLKSYMHSIFFNLILNSIKYRNPDIDPVIEISATTSNGKLYINYKDNGRGIDTSKHAKEIFGLYKRFDTSVEGKGMGLFMVKMQVEDLGGSIVVQSIPNKGTQFTLEFPQNHMQKSDIN